MRVRSSCRRPICRRAWSSRWPDLCDPGGRRRGAGASIRAPGARDRREYAAPRNDMEQRLCGIWAQVLGLPRVGIHDNFFELGGDSIISLQVVARARQVGLSLSTRHLFQHQTVAQLAQVVKSASEPLREQGPVTGPVPLTPVQLQLLRHDAGARPPLQPVRAAGLARAPGAVPPGEGARAGGGPPRRPAPALPSARGRLAAGQRRPRGELLPLLQVDLSATPASEQSAALEAEASRLQASFVLSQPPLLRAALFHLGDGQQRLLLVAHHLVVDAVSCCRGRSSSTSSRRRPVN